MKKPGVENLVRLSLYKFNVFFCEQISCECRVVVVWAGEHCAQLAVYIFLAPPNICSQVVICKK